MLGDLKMTIVFKVSEELKKEMISYYADKKRDKTPPYAVFQAMDADTIVTLYESGKVMFQGISADIDAAMWSQREKKLTGKQINVTSSEDKKKKETNASSSFANITSIGSDEVGTGDFFGPIVVTACYVKKEDIPWLYKIGVKDSKAITDDKIASIAPQLVKKIDYTTFILNNHDYNQYQSKGYNMNQIKSILHNKVLFEMKKKHSDYDKIVVDQFVYPKKYYEHIQESTQIVSNITFETKAENKYASVAAASCISRYIFLLKMKELGEQIGMKIVKGASDEVDKLAAEIVKKYGPEKLEHIAKLNFKNSEKYKQYLK